MMTRDELLQRYAAGERDFVGANLKGASLGGANLGDANLGGAYLGGANLGGAMIPSPTSVLLASWGDLSRELTRDAMLFDAFAHDDPLAFDAWASGGPCPYEGRKFQRACNFEERKEWWAPGEAPSAYALMVAIFREKGVQWP